MPATIRFCLCLLLCCAPSAVFAGDSAVVVRVGPAELTLAELEARLRSLPRYQLDALGNSELEIKKAFVERLIVPEFLFAEEARRRKLQDSLALGIATREVLRSALETDLRRELAAKRPVSDEEVARYYAEHRAEYEKPLRLRLFRILTDSEAKARELLDKARGMDLVAWRELARKNSSDAATRERGGDLGFVHPDGATDVPRVRVDQALYEAAAKVENGALVPEPVPDGKQFAVVWRRGSLDATSGGLEEHGPHIKRLLEEDQLRSALAEIANAKRGVEKNQSNVALLEELELPAFGAGDKKAPVRIKGPPGASARPGVEATSQGAR